MRRLAPLAALLLCACGRYADFRLPDAGPPEPGAYVWTARPQPVFSTSAVDTLNPSVVARGGQLLNFYSLFDGRAWHSALATSPDGLTWQDSGRFLSPDAATWEGAYIAANGAALNWKGEFLYFYQAGSPPRIGLARSPDARHWTRLPAPVLDFGPRGAWDERATADPYVIESGGRLYLYYLGEDRARRQRLGVAVSDDAVHWTKLRMSPVLELGAAGSMDGNGLGEPAVWRAHGAWWMLYTGRASNEVRRLGLARSLDGVAWQRTPLVIEGASDWNSKVLCDPTVIAETDRVRVWFGGGNRPQPAENLAGQIGYGELHWR